MSTFHSDPGKQNRRTIITQTQITNESRSQENLIKKFLAGYDAALAEAIDARNKVEASVKAAIVANSGLTNKEAEAFFKTATGKDALAYALEESGFKG